MQYGVYVTPGMIKLQLHTLLVQSLQCILYYSALKDQVTCNEQPRMHTADMTKGVEPVQGARGWGASQSAACNDTESATSKGTSSQPCARKQIQEW